MTRITLNSPEVEDYDAEDGETGIQCETCGNNKASYQPAPYASDLHGDYTLHALCDNCAHHSGMEL